MTNNYKIYCLKCKTFTVTIKPRITKTKNNRYIIIGHCDRCKRKKFQFISKSKVGKGLLNSMLDKLPFEMHVPGYQYCGPGTQLEQRMAHGDSGINKLDRACKIHDIHYSKFNSVKDRHPADKQLAQIAKEVVYDPKSSLKDKTVAQLVRASMNAKVKLGMGVS
jgi:Phospholipase A2-like domain/Domain of unknown function (DUF5679)